MKCMLINTYVHPNIWEANFDSWVAKLRKSGSTDFIKNLFYLFSRIFCNIFFWNFKKIVSKPWKVLTKLYLNSVQLFKLFSERSWISLVITMISPTSNASRKSWINSFLLLSDNALLLFYHRTCLFFVISYLDFVCNHIFCFPFVSTFSNLQKILKNLKSNADLLIDAI